MELKLRAKTREQDEIKLLKQLSSFFEPCLRERCIALRVAAAIFAARGHVRDRQ